MGGFIYATLAATSAYGAVAAAKPVLLAVYAARIPPLVEPRTLFGAVLFPVLEAPPGNYDEIFVEAESYDGPALIIAYSHCIAHGINMTTAMQNQKAAVQCGQWLLYRYNPERAAAGENPLQIDSSPPRMKVEEYLGLENRFTMLARSKPETSKQLFAEAQHDVDARWQRYQRLAASNLKTEKKESP